MSHDHVGVTVSCPAAKAAKTANKPQSIIWIANSIISAPSLWWAGHDASVAALAALPAIPADLVTVRAPLLHRCRVLYARLEGCDAEGDGG